MREDYVQERFDLQQQAMDRIEEKCGRLTESPDVTTMLNLIFDMLRALNLTTRAMAGETPEEGDHEHTTGPAE